MIDKALETGDDDGLWEEFIIITRLQGFIKSDKVKSITMYHKVKLMMYVTASQVQIISAKENSERWGPRR